MNWKLFLKQYIKMFAQNIMLPVWYAVWKKGPVQQGLVILADAHHDRRPAAMDLIYKELCGKTNSLGNPLQIREMYLDYQKASPVSVLQNMFRFMKLYARAEAVVICDNFLPVASCRKRKETKVVQLWHGCGALKRFGYDTEDDIPRQYHGNVFQNTDLVTVSAQSCVAPFASAMRLEPNCVRPIGVSRTDLYFREDWKQDCIRQFQTQYPEAAGKKIVLWAPTFRGSPGAPQLPKLDLPLLQESLGEDWFVVSRVHPHLISEAAQTQCKIPTERLFPVADVLVADYSSLIFEYLLFHKALVLYAPDLEEYQSKRGFYLSYSDIPGYVVRREDELADAVRKEYRIVADAVRKEELGMMDSARREGRDMPEISVSVDEKKYIKDWEEKRRRFLERYMSGCDGHATQRIAAWIAGNAPV